MTRFSLGNPSSKNNFAHEIAAAPAPDIANFVFLISLPVISKAFNIAAEAIIAVPC